MDLTHQEYRQVQAHLGALSVLLRAEPTALCELAALEQALTRIQAASGLDCVRNPAFFNGRYLNRQGRAAIDALFAAGLSQLEAARRMVISPAAGHANFKRWRRERVAEAAGPG